MRPVEAVLEDGTVIVPEESEASRLHNKGSYGIPQSGGSLRLHLIEAVYLVDKERLTVPGTELKTLLSGAVRKVPGFEVRFSVYRDLRERGYTISSPLLLTRADGTTPDWDLEVFERESSSRGGRRPTLRIFSVSERAPLVLGEVVHMVRSASTVSNRVLLSIVDEEGDITYYEVATVEPSGRVSPKVKGTFEGHLLEDRVVVTGVGAKALHANGFYGKPATGTLQLSFLEAAYLVKAKALSVRSSRTGRKVGLRTFTSRARERQPDFNERLRVYTDLRDRGMVVKTGFKYGTHFRVYEGDPSNTHARYLMHAVPERYESSWPELSRAVRLAHGVRKEIMFTRVLGSKGLQYVQFKRVRP